MLVAQRDISGLIKEAVHVMRENRGITSFILGAISAMYTHKIIFSMLFGSICKIQKNCRTVTVALTIEHHGGHSRTPAHISCPSGGGGLHIRPGQTICIDCSSLKR